MPFGHFLDVGHLIVNNYQLDDRCGRYVRNYYFNLRSKIMKMTMTIEDVGMILGLPRKGIEINFFGKEIGISHDETKFFKNFFANKIHNQVKKFLLKNNIECLICVNYKCLF